MKNIIIQIIEALVKTTPIIKPKPEITNGQFSKKNNHNHLKIQYRQEVINKQKIVMLNMNLIKLKLN